LAGFGSITLEQARLVGLNPDGVQARDSRRRAWHSDQRQSRSGNSSRGALDNAGLSVSKASAAISVNGGRRACATSSCGPTAPICRRRQRRSRRRHARCAAYT
jgi:hypothetical protein